MSKFKRPVRYDADLANDGVWFAIEDELGNDYGMFKCIWWEAGSPRYRAAQERLERAKPALNTGNGFRQPKKPTKREAAREGDLQTIRNFVENVLVDWRVDGADGKPVPFTEADAIEYFDVDDPTAIYCFTALLAKAADVRNFQPAEQEGERPEGN